MKLGETITIFRIANNYDEKQFIDICDISCEQLKGIEKYNKYPPYEILKRIADALNVEVREIIEISQNSEKDNWDYKKTLFEVLKIYIGK